MMENFTIIRKRITRLIVLFLFFELSLINLNAQTVIQVGVVYNLSQAPTSTVNYQLNLPSPGEITIHINNWISTFDWGRDFDRIYVYNSEGKAVSRNTLSSVADPFLFHMFKTNTGLTFRIGKAGVYTIAVHSGERKEVDWGTTTMQNYNMSVTAVYCSDIYELNDSITTASPITIGSTVTAFQWKVINTSEVGGDEDWYKITINTPGKLKIDMVNWVGVYDWSHDYDRLYVYNANGVSIGSKSGHDFYNWMMGGGTDIAPVVTQMNLSHAGIYYLRYHAGEGTSTTPYHFLTSFIPANDPYEPNDNFSTAKPISSSNVWYQAYEWRSQDSTMNVGGDEDYYYFVASGAGQYSIALDGWIGIYDWGADYDRIYIYDSNKNSVGASPLNWMMGNTTINFNVPSAGKYYIRLHCGSVSSIDGYKFKLSGTIVGIEDLKNPVSQFHFYPNPASGIINLNIGNKNNEDLILNIYNTIGELVRSELLEENQRQINVSDLKNGVYLVSINSKEWIEKQKLIIQR